MKRKKDLITLWHLHLPLMMLKKKRDMEVAQVDQATSLSRTNTNSSKTLSPSIDSLITKSQEKRITQIRWKATRRSPVVLLLILLPLKLMLIITTKAIKMNSKVNIRKTSLRREDQLLRGLIIALPTTSRLKGKRLSLQLSTRLNPSRAMRKGLKRKIRKRLMTGHQLNLSISNPNNLHSNRRKSLHLLFQIDLKLRPLQFKDLFKVSKAQSPLNQWQVST